MGYLSCRADSSIATCRSITSISPILKLPNFAAPRPKDDAGDADAPSSSTSTSPSPGNGGAEGGIRQFSYQELEAATANFSDTALLGRGSHGSVYKAVLRGGRAVAVKRSSRRPCSPSAPRDEVANEIDILSGVRSPRLVNLLGFASSSSAAATGRRELLLVVEFMPNGTLYDLLHSNPRPPGWARRMGLALQTAKALLTLHSAAPPVIHRDVKSANVLLDRNLDARLCDFGLALRAPAAAPGAPSPARSTPPAGTLGYLDPSYVTPESLSTKTDVFSFGILMLEITSGRKAIDVAHSPPSVVEWAVPLLRRGKVAALFDPRIPLPRDPGARRQLAALAATCVRSSRERRPSMAEVVEQLKVLSRTVPARAWNGLAVVGSPCSAIDTETTILSFSKKPPCPPSLNAKVFSEAVKGEGRNPSKFMARPARDATQRQEAGVGTSPRSGISSGRTVRAGNLVLPLPRNQTVTRVRSGVSLESDAFQSLNGEAHARAGDCQQTKCC